MLLLKKMKAVKITSADQLVSALKKEKEKQNITNYRLAKLTGLTQGALSQIFAGKRTPEIETALKIAKALKFKIILDYESN